MKAKLVLWLVTAMLRWTLPPGAWEAERGRYEAIATDAVEVAFDAAERPLFRGPSGRTKTATLLLAIASYESTFRREVENGTKRGDRGRSWCLMQVNLGKRKIRLDGDGWAWGKSGDDDALGGPDLAADRKVCFRVALHMARVSYRACGDLSLYTSGRCSRTEPAARYRAFRARKLSASAPVRDSDIVGLASTPGRRP